MRKTFKILFFILFVLVLTLPLVFSYTRLNDLIALKGAVTATEKPEFSMESWFNSKFQDKYEKYVNDNIGFRPYFVRLRNQIAFSVFGKAKAAGVIEGKERYLYELNYIKAYNGVDFIGADSIRNTVKRLKSIQDSLAKRNKYLLVCLAPGKGSFYPEYFPDEYQLPKTDTTNYVFYARHLKSLGVNHIDFNRWFLQMKDTSKCILYPKYGIHWSNYGMTLATDSLVSRVEQLMNEDLPDLITDNVKTSKKLVPMDYDIADGMNLIFQLPSQPMCYPETHWESGEGKVQPKSIVIADSFYWSMFGLGVWTKSFSPGGFWFYNRQIYPESFNNPLDVEDVNIRDVINGSDLFILLVTEANLPRFPWGFDQNVLEALNPEYIRLQEMRDEERKRFQEEIQKTIRNIRSDKNWMEDIRRKASEKKISVDSMLVLDAMWIIERKKSQKKN